MDSQTDDEHRGAGTTYAEEEADKDHIAAVVEATTRMELGELAALAHQAGIDELHTIPGLEEALYVDRRTEVYGLERDSETYEVHVTSDVTLEDYKRTTRPEDWKLFEDQIEPLIGKSMVFVGSTYEGGGVAMIRPPLIHLLRLAGVDAHWMVMEPDDHAFEVTKKMHNLQQDVLPTGATFTDEDKEVHKQFGLTNFEHLKHQEVFASANYYVIDDPQPAGMIRSIKEMNPEAKIIFRNHIQTDRDKMAVEGSPQRAIYEYLRDECGVDLVDTYVAHPVEGFVPYNTPNVAYLPPTSDEYEDLNRTLTPEEIEEGLDFVDKCIALQNLEQRELRGSGINDQEPLDRNRPRITLFARYDLAKGMSIGMEMHRRTIEKLREMNVPEEMFPELVIAGNGSVDDKDRQLVLNQMLDLRLSEYGDVSKYIKVIGMHHNYSAVNALMRTSAYVTNPSIKEGFEHRATEGIIKGVPAIVSNRGGLPLQVKDGVSGFVLDFDNLTEELDRVAEHIAEGIVDPDVYQALKERTIKRAEEFNKREISTVANGIRWARVFNGQGDRTWHISDLALAA